MASGAPGLIHMKFHQFSIENKLKNGLKSSRRDSYEIWLCFNWQSMKELPQKLQAGFMWNWIVFPLRISQRVASRAPGWVHMKLDHCSTKSQLKHSIQRSCLDSYETFSFQITNELINCLKGDRVDSYEIWWFFHRGWNREWPQERQAGFIWNLIILQWRINQRMVCKAPVRIHMKWIVSFQVRIK